jgi:hypothetical protein
MAPARKNPQNPQNPQNPSNPADQPNPPPDNESEQPPQQAPSLTFDDVRALMAEHSQQLAQQFEQRLDALESRPQRRASGPPSDDSDDSDDESSDDDDDQNETPSSTAGADLPAAAIKDPKVTPPTRFGGKSSEFLNFITQCEVTFEMCPNTYRRAERRVLFIINNLEGSALRWARSIFRDSNHPFRTDYKAFRKALYDMYDDHSYHLKAEDLLASLEQTKSASAYAVEFKILAAPLGYNKKALCSMFFKGLKAPVKRAIITQGRAQKFNALVAQAISLDQMQHQIRIAEKKTTTTSNPHSSSRSSGTSSSRQQSNSSSSTGRQLNPGVKRESSLTPEDKERYKKQGLCFRCSEKGHRVSDCPNNPKNQNQNRGAASNATRDFTPQTPTPPYVPRAPTTPRPEPIYPIPNTPPGNWPSHSPQRSEL